ncbi:MAG TPA: hypothetical protein VG826_21420, partial [Pirellulales bacterium]|nr:hypothetical protein [Pirellulales bacterium]
MLSAVSWSGGAAGDWNVAGNWSGLSPGETAPGAADDVTISGNVTVTHGSGSDQVHTLTLGTGATLDVNGGSAITLLLSSGTAVSNDGTINLGDAAGTNSGALFFNGNQTLGTTAGATGIVVLGGSSSDRLIQSFGGQTLTIGGGITIQGDDGGVGGAASTLVNQGTIDADTSGGTINVALGVNGSNSGTIKADSGGSLTVYGSSAGTWTNEAGASISIAGGGKLGIDNNPAAPWTNLGTISTTASTVNLNGAFTQAGLGTFSRDAASTVNLTGKLTGDVALNASTGNWNLVGGELSTGAFSASGATLFATGQGGTLNAETLDSPIDFSTNNGAAATVTGGLSLDNVTLNVGNAAGSSNAVLLFNGDQTLGT